MGARQLFLFRAAVENEMTTEIKPKAKIFIVDDMPGPRDAARKTFEGLGCEVAETESAELAEEMLASGLRPDCIILDLKLPGMSGGRFLDVIRRRWEPLAERVVLWSSNIQSEVTSYMKEAYKLNELNQPTSAPTPAGMWKVGGENTSTLGEMLVYIVGNLLTKHSVPISPQFAAKVQKAFQDLVSPFGIDDPHP
jgi:CheY-like chemotaxis protein